MKLRTTLRRWLTTGNISLLKKISASTDNLRRVLKWLVSLFLVVEILAIVITVLIDMLRKWRSLETSGFPTVPSTSIQIPSNELRVHTVGTATYKAMLQAIRQAENHIFFETFIWKPDEVGQLFKDELLAAAQRGVEVFCIYDVFANLVVPPRFKRFPKIPHLHILHFGVFRSIFPSRRNTGRDHRKILTVDGRLGFVGGYNIGSLYATQWRDTHLEIAGTAVEELENAFRDFWNDHRTQQLPRLPYRGLKEWQPQIQAALNAPNRLLFPIRGMYLNALTRATTRIWITQAYFIPDREISSALINAAQRGVDVRVLIPEVSNHIAADWVARSYYGELLNAGVQIWLYQHAMIHAKTATVDGRWTTIGTANIDRLSLIGNYEINLEIHSTALAEHMEQIFHTDLSQAYQLTLSQWEKRGVLSRLTERIIRPLGAIL